MSTARLEVVVTSSGVVSADKDLKQLTATARETERQQKRLAVEAERTAAAEEKAAAKAVAAAEKKTLATEKAAARSAAAVERQAQQAAAAAERQAASSAKQAQREADAWNDTKQKALARYEREAEAAERAAARKIAAAERAAKREDEHWNNAIQRAKAGLDGVLPIRPRLEAMLQGVQQQLSAKSVASVPVAGIASVASNPLGALGSSLSGALPQIAAATVSIAGLHKVIAETSAYDSLIARLAGVTGGTEAARKQFDKLEELSDSTIFSENEMTAAFIRLEQNGLKPTEETLTSFANIASATGNTLEQVSEASLAASLGNFKGLRQFGIKAVQEGDNLKVTFKGVSTTIGNSAEAITQYLVSIGETDFAGAAARQLDTMGGSVKKVEDAWGDLFREVGRSAVGEFISTGMKEAAAAINLATSAFEALLYTASQRPKFSGMSAELANFAKGATKWGAPQSDEEISLVDKTQAIIEQLNKGSVSAADRALREYQDREDTLKNALTSGLSGDIGAAIDENRRQYEASVNAGNKPQRVAATKERDGDAFFRKLQIDNQRNVDAKAEAVAEAGQREYEAVKASLARQEDTVQASYEKQKGWLAEYTGPDAAELLAANEVLWDQHLAQLQAKRDKDQLELQKRLQNIGIGPRSQMQVVTSKYAGQRMELETALSDNMSGKNGASLQLEAEQTYADKSVEIERARAAEIAQINQELTQQSLQNASLAFGGLATALRNASGEQSKEYRALFAVQQAFGIASATASMFIAMSKASEAGPLASIPLYIKAAAQGTQIIAQLSSLSYSGAYDSGGTIPAGSYGLVAERRPELLTAPTFVRGPATVVGGQATANLMGRASTERPIINLRVVNAPDGHVNVYRASSLRERTVINDMRRNQYEVRGIARGGL